jgi:hypothetical protein
MKICPNFFTYVNTQIGHYWAIDSTEITDGIDSYNIIVNIMREDATEYLAQSDDRTITYETISRVHR